MNNEWKMVPVEPTEEMRAEIMSGINHNHMVANYKAMLAAAPVPPAGDVEVLATLDRSCDSGVTLTDTGASWHMDGTDLVDIDHVTRLTADVDRWHDICVERTTERDGLLAEIVGYQKERSFWVSRNDALHAQIGVLQSELTKARELLRGICKYADELLAEVNYVWSCAGSTGPKQTHKGLGYSNAMDFLAHQSAPAANFIACNVDESCGQAAPAAKDGK